jgi:hypothetical protein
MNDRFHDTALETWEWEGGCCSRPEIEESEVADEPCESVDAADRLD